MRGAERVRPRLGVVVVEPLAVVRAGLGKLIGERQEMEVLAEAGSADDCLEALRRIRRSRPVVMVGTPVDRMAPIADGIDSRRQIASRLTTREQEVLRAAARGLTSREIARHLGVRERTVTTHLGRIYGKLGVTSRVSAVIEAARSGLVAVDLSEGA